MQEIKRKKRRKRRVGKRMRKIIKIPTLIRLLSLEEKKTREKTKLKNSIITIMAKLKCVWPLWL